MEKLALYVPALEELWFYREMMSDPVTMSYNANWDMDFTGYHKDTGCIDFPQAEWADWYRHWIGREPERFFAYIRRVSDGAWIGNVNFHRVPGEAFWEMGIVIHAPYRGKGYAVPALRLMLDHAFRDCGVTELHNSFEVHREAAAKSHLSAGFRDAGVKDGIRHLVLTREKYLKNSADGPRDLRAR